MKSFLDSDFRRSVQLQIKIKQNDQNRNLGAVCLCTGVGVSLFSFRQQRGTFVRMKQYFIITEMNFALTNFHFVSIRTLFFSSSSSPHPDTFRKSFSWYYCSSSPCYIIRKIFSFQIHISSSSSTRTTNNQLYSWRSRRRVILLLGK